MKEKIKMGQKLKGGAAPLFSILTSIKRHVFKRVKKRLYSQCWGLSSYIFSQVKLDML